nr:unnamed protein product [Callosobruchus chinensis]CAH7722376.1 unnamed protein product [Callosobruchus chinensis]
MISKRSMMLVSMLGSQTTFSKATQMIPCVHHYSKYTSNV